MEKVNLTEKLALINDYWNPRIIGELNDCYVKIVKLQGEFIWHHHENEDELFLIMKGTLRMRLRERDVLLKEGDFLIVPKGVEHMPVAETGEVHIVLLEPKTTLNTGNVQNARTVATLERI